MHPRKPMFALPCALLLAVAAMPAVAKNRYVYLVNDMHDRIESFALSQKGSGLWTPMQIGEAGLRPGSSETLAIAYGEGDGCLYDAKLELSGGKTFLHRDLDLCRNVSYHPGRYLRVAALPVAQDGERP